MLLNGYYCVDLGTYRHDNLELGQDKLENDEKNAYFVRFFYYLQKESRCY